ncbi:hypothetical protein P153DRAFT_280453 [Dothidotthia symphoricarpi CBS 119687]|uniref:DUF7728 domain-containing protein n=1 Tax=Dothidotthia symphoricarpi CBS 119687 TaxID=1392245 RepID=A0A6A6ARA6_9PLEO|nr:uncharacterized protein P153DRAFT_280453 [Dothidotthia symphoricarpi CBS 119687]KAF2133708.1 hypothetical protein P153DRAFT_280453 [Dothidotthia symphoricarpi CBS 119687]
MRFLIALGFSAAFGAVAASSDAIPDKTTAPEITVVESNKNYLVKLDCVECPFAVWDSSSEVSWQTPPQDNALLLNFNIDAQGTALLLNGKRILPLDPMPLDVKAPQVAANQTHEIAEIDEGSQHDLSLQYEHSLLRDKEPGKFWVQFNVTGWVLQQTTVVHMDKVDQKLVQVLLHKEANGTDLRIEEIQVVAREDRKQPYRMKCGRPAIVKTTFDPAEWDEFGKFGTWSRIMNLVLGNLGGFWYDNFQHNARVLLLALWLAITVFLVRRWHQARQEEKDVLAEDDAESALLPSYQYSVIPVIKIEEYD